MFAASAAALAMAFSPASAADGPKCLQADMVDHTHVIDASNLVFYMKNGKAWLNRLPTACKSLQLHGFVIHGQDMELCGGQGVTIITSEQACVLGNFEPYADTRH
jgi:hypothetical protein